MPFIDETVRLISSPRLFITAFVFPTEITRAIKAAVGVALAIEVCSEARFEIQRAEIALMDADQHFRRASQRLRFVANVVNRHPRHVLRAGRTAGFLGRVAVLDKLHAPGFQIEFSKASEWAHFPA